MGAATDWNVKNVLGEYAFKLDPLYLHPTSLRVDYNHLVTAITLTCHEIFISCGKLQRLKRKSRDGGRERCSDSSLFTHVFIVADHFGLSAPPKATAGSHRMAEVMESETAGIRGERKRRRSV